MVRLTFLGDIMCDYEMSLKFDKYIDNEGKFDFDSVFCDVKPLLSQSDYVFANLETPISYDSTDLTHSRWRFNSPIEFAQAVKKCGIKFVSTANNHCLDRGLRGIKSTIDSLNAIGLKHCGIQVDNKNSFSIVDVNGMHIGIVAYTYGTNAFSNYNYLPKNGLKNVNLLQEQEGRIKSFWNARIPSRFNRVYDTLESLLYPNNRNKKAYEKETISFYRKKLIEKDIKSLKKNNVDFIVAYLHIGGQYNNEPSDYTKKVTNWFIKKGCSIVIDNHEHVIHGIKMENNTIAAFALGNFLGSAGVTKPPYDRFSEYSIALHVDIDSDRKQVDSVSFSILKTILLDSGKYKIYECSNLYALLDSHNKNELKSDIGKITELFSGKRVEGINQEYVIWRNN